MSTARATIVCLTLFVVTLQCTIPTALGSFCIGPCPGESASSDAHSQALPYTGANTQTTASVSTAATNSFAGFQWQGSNPTPPKKMYWAEVAGKTFAEAVAIIMADDPFANVVSDCNVDMYNDARVRVCLDAVTGNASWAIRG